jgi:hypothetical protein
VSELKLIPASQNRRSGGWSDDDYDVVLVETQKTIGRIFLNTVSSMNTTAWFWGIDYFCAGTRRPYYGQAESKEAASRLLARALVLDLRSLALMRIAVGAILIADLVIRAPDLALFYSAGGAVPPEFHEHQQRARRALHAFLGGTGPQGSRASRTCRGSGGFLVRDDFRPFPSMDVAAGE